jgi:hypothetical protein
MRQKCIFAELPIGTAFSITRNAPVARYVKTDNCTGDNAIFTYCGTNSEQQMPTEFDAAETVYAENVL